MNHSRHQGDQRTLWSEGTNRAHSLSLAYYPCELAYVVTPYVQTTPSFTNLCLDRPHYILNEYTLQNFSKVRAYVRPQSVVGSTAAQAAVLNCL
jgi:hypothetical protein